MVDFVAFARYLMKKAKVLLAATGFVFLASLLYCVVLAQPVYEATAQIYMVNSQDSILNLSDLQIGSYLTSDYQWIFRTWEVHQMVIDKLKLPYTVSQMEGNLTVTNPNNTRVLVITYASHDPQEAAEIANTYAEVASQYISDTMLTSKPSMISAARVPTSPARPRKLLIVGTATLTAAVVTGWVLFIMFALNDRIKTADDLYDHFETLPLTVIPYSEKLSKDRFKV